MSIVIERQAAVKPSEPAPKKAGTVRVALVQSKSDLGTETYDPRDANLRRALADIDKAAAAGAGLVVFGEMHLSGYRTDERLHKWSSTISPPDRHVSAVI